jgi:hypothetical protein
MENREERIEEPRREFVEPTVAEEASLTEVTLQLPGTGIVPEFGNLFYGDAFGGLA